MVETVDAIIVDLIARDQGYIKTLNEATAAHQRAYKSGMELQKLGTSPLPQYAGGLGKMAAAAADAHEKAAARIKRSRKDQSDTVQAADRADADAAKKATAERVAAEKSAAKATADALKAEQNARDAAANASAKAAAAAQRDAEKKAAAAKAAADAVVAAAEREAAAQARIAAMVERSAASSGVKPGTGALLGATVPREATGQANAPSFEAAGAGAGTAEQLAAETEINHALANRFDLVQRAQAAEGEVRRTLQDEAALILRAETYRRAGLSDTEAAIRAETELAAIEKLRAERAEKASRAPQSKGKGLKQFAEGATLGYAPALATAAGIAAAGAVFEGASLISSSVEYGRQLQETAKQIGLTTEELQVYQIAAKQAGVSNSQLATSFGQFQDGLGKAKTGSKDFIKDFAALGINTKDLKTFTDAGSALPTIIDRLSAIQDPAKRAAVGYKLFGDAYRQLDPILSGGNQKIADLTKQLQAAGAILSDGQIDKLADASKILGDLSDKLKVDVAGVVADNAKSIEDLATSLSKLTIEVIKFINAHPEAAFAIIGGLMGGSVGGLPGVAIGTVAGYAAGAHVAGTAADTNMDPTFRRQQLANAQAELAARQQVAAGKTPAGGTSILGGIITLRHSPTENSGATIASAQAEVDRQTALLTQAAAEPKPVPKRTVVGGSVNNRLLGQINAPQGEEEKLRKEALERTKRYNDQMARLQDQLLDTEMQQTVGSDAQLKLKQQQIKTDHDRTEADIKSALGEKKLNDADAANLIKKNDELAVQRNAVLALQKRVDLYNRINDIAQQDMQAQEGILQSQASLAQTAAERRKLSLQALDLQQKAEEKADRDTINSPDPNVSDTDRAKAQDRLNNSAATYAQKRTETEYGTRGPLKEYLDSLPATANQLDEALQQASADGLKSLNDGLATTIGNFLHLHGIAGQFLEDLIKIALQREALALFGGGTGGSLFSSIGSLLGIGSATDSLTSGPFAGTKFGASAIPGLAGGGSFTIGGNGGIDNNMLSINGQPVARVNQGEQLNIVPANQQVRGGGSGGVIHLTQNISVDGRNSVTPADFAAQIVAVANDHANKVASAAAQIGAAGGADFARRTAVLGGRPTLPRGLG
jgi:hypothetical protein